MEKTCKNSQFLKLRGTLALSDIKTYCKAFITNAVWYRPMAKQTNKIKLKTQK